MCLYYDSQSVNSVYCDTHPIRSKVKGCVMLKEAALVRSLRLCLNTLRTGAFKLFKCTFPGSKQFKSTLIMRFFKYL